jgi:hypothetical protein
MKIESSERKLVSVRNQARNFVSVFCQENPFSDQMAPGSTLNASQNVFSERFTRLVGL